MTTAPANAAFTLDAKIGRVLAEVALLPSAVQGAFRTRVYDLLSHHRLSVMKHHGMSRVAATRMLATRLWRYTKVSNKPGEVAGVVGEGFAAAESGPDFGGRFLSQLESGAEISAGGAMIVPVGAGREMLRGHGGRERWNELLRSGDTDLIRTRSGRMLLVGSTDGRKFDGHGMKSIIYGVMTRRRRQPPQLGYYRQFDDVQARHVAKFERDLDRAATAAGQEALVERAGENKTISAAYVEALKRYLDANPGRHAGARRAAQAAARLARQANLTRPGERA